MSMMIVLFVYIVAIIVEMPKLLKKPKINILLPYIALMGLALTTQVLFELKVKLPSPLQPIAYLIADVWQLK